MIYDILAAFGSFSLCLGFINLALGRRSQIDAWCNARPWVAGALKVLRGVGVDPWQFVQAANLFVRGRLPDQYERVIDLVSKKGPASLAPPSALPVFKEHSGAYVDDGPDTIPSLPPSADITKILLVLCLVIGPSLTACSTALMQAEVAEQCNVPLAKLDVEYAWDLMLVCPGKELYACDEYKELERRYAARYDALGEACSKVQDG